MRGNMAQLIGTGGNDKQSILERICGKMEDGMTIQINGQLEEKMTNDEKERLRDELAQLGIVCVVITEKEE